MTVTTTTVRNEYAGNGVTITFPFTFRVLRREDLIVSIIDDATGAETGLTYAIDYTITGVGASAGGTVSLGLYGAPAAGKTVVLRREMELTQPNDFSNQSRFYPEAHERSFDRATMLIQQLQDGVDRSITQPENGSDWYDAQGRRIINLGDAIELTDAVNVQTMNSAIGDALEGVGGYVVPLVWEAIGDGVTTGVNIEGAPIADPKSYHVTIDGLVQVPTTDYTVTLATQVLTFTTPPPTDAAILVRCVGYAAAVVAQDWDADGNRITNVGAPVADTDAATKGYVDDATADLANAVHTHAGSDIVSGVIGPDRLGTGTRTGTKFLRDDGYWVDIDASLALPFTSKGDTLAFDGTDAVRVAVGTDGNALIADSSQPSGVRWGTPAFFASDVAYYLNTAFLDSSTIDVQPAGEQFSFVVIDESIDTQHIADEAITGRKIKDGVVGTTHLFDDSIETRHITDANVTQAKLSATGTTDSTTYLRGDWTWQPISAIPVASHEHAATDITSGLMDAERLGSGYGAITPGDENLYYLSADGSWSIPAGGGGGGSGWSNEASQDAVGAILLPSPTVTLTYNDATPSITAAVVAGSIGIDEINTAELDARYALVGSGSLPSGGTAATFLRGDGAWTSTIPSLLCTSAVYLGSTSNLLTDSGISNSGTYTAEARRVAPYARDAKLILRPSLSNDGASAQLSIHSSSGTNSYAKLNTTSVGVHTFEVSCPITALSTIAATGAVTAASFTGSIAASNINSGVIGTARLGTGTADNTKFLRGDGVWEVPASGGSITVADTARIDLTLTGSQVSADLVAGGVTSTYLADSGVTSAKIADSAVTTAKINAEAVTNPKIGPGAVTTSKVADSTITTAKIADGQVTAAKLATGSVTIAKISATGSANSTTFLRGDGTWAAGAGGGGGGGVSYVFNVRDYGAAGDGVTDDRAAILSAITAAISAGRGIVYFPAGVYAMSSYIMITSQANISLIGDGFAVSHVRSTATTLTDSCSLFFFYLCQNIEIRGLTLDNNSKLFPANASVLSFQECTDFIVDSAHIINARWNGINIVYSCARFMVSNCYIHCSSALVTNANQKQAVLVSNSGGMCGPGSFVNNDLEGFGLLIDGEDILIQGNWIHDYDYGSGIATNSQQCIRAKIIGNTCSSNYPPGFDVNITAPTGIENWSPYSVVKGNICFLNAGPGIAQGGSYSVVEGNICYDNATHWPAGGNAGIFLHQDGAIPTLRADHCVIANNVCFETGGGYQSYGYGEYPTGAFVGVRLIGNKFSGPLGAMTLNGTSTLRSIESAFIQSGDPGAVGAGSIWIQQ